MAEPKLLDHLLGQVCHLHHGRIRAKLRDLGLYRGQPAVLEALMKEEGRTHSDLAAWMHVTPATVTKMIQRMEKAGHVERRDDPDDLRISRVYLTEDGRAVHAQLQAVFQDVDAETFAGFTSKERVHLEQLLRRIRSNLLDATGTGEKA